MFDWFKTDSTTAADLYVDLGTANTIIAGRGMGILLNEPSLIAYMEPSSGRRKIFGVGTAAQEIIKRNPGNVLSQKPIRDGVIADFDLAQEMLKLFLSTPLVKEKFRRPRVVVSLPYGVTEVEKKAVVDACKSAGAKKVFLIDEPMAAAIGAGILVKSAQGNMIIDIGGGTTEVAVIALADIVYCEAVRVGGHRLDEGIISYLRRNKNFIITEIIAEKLKIELGTALPKKDIHSQMISGRDADTGLSKTIEITSEDVGLAMNDNLQEIVNAIHKAIEHTPPELVSDIIETGITLAGGGALIKHFATKIQNEVRLNVVVAENPLTAIAIGGEKVLSDPDLLEKIELPLE